MRNIKILFNSLIVIPLIIPAHTYENINYYGSLITGVYERYHTAGIIASSVAHKDYSASQELTMWHQLSVTLSRRGMPSVIAHFGRFRERLEFYKSHPSLPLVIVAIDRPGDIHRVSNLTSNLEMNYGVWLLLFIGDVDEEACNFCRNPRFNSLNLKFNSLMLVMCCGSDIIQGWWSGPQNRMTIREISRWTQSKQSIEWFTEDDFFTRRSSLEGRAFQITYSKDSTYIWKNGEHFQGFLSHVLEELSRSMNFTIAAMIEEDDSGILDPGTTIWTGVFGRIQRHEADMSIDGFSRTISRSTVVDFTLPIIKLDSRLYYQKSDATDVQWNTYFEAFSVFIWIAIIIVILVMSLFMTLIESRSRQFNYFPLICKHYLHVWGIYCAQCVPGLAVETPMRLLYISICMSALMISFTYSASLTSVLAVSKLPFNSLKQFAQAGTYGLIAVDDSEEYDLLKFSEDPVLQQMSKLLIPKALLPWSYVEGFHQICEEQVAFYAHYATSMRYPEREMPCEMHSIKTGYVQLSGIITPRGSEFTHAINYYLQRFKQNGILQRLENIYIVVEYTPEPVLLSANLRGVAPILIILISGVIVASLIFTVEWIFYYFRYIRYKSRQTPFTL